MRAFSFEMMRLSASGRKHPALAGQQPTLSERLRWPIANENRGKCHPGVCSKPASSPAWQD